MKVVIYGIGSFAKLLYFYLKNDTGYEVVGFCVDKKYIKTTQCDGLVVVAFEEVEDIFPPSDFCMMVAIGYSNMRSRKEMFLKAKNKGYILPNYIHSSVISYCEEMGENNIIFPNCVVEPNVKIGDNNIIWSMSLLAHDSKIGNHNYFAPKCFTSGFCMIGDLCFMGSGSGLIDRIILEDESYLVAGSILLENTKAQAMYIGNPAHFVRYNKKGICIK